LRFALQGLDIALIDSPDAPLGQDSTWRGIASVCDEIAQLGCRATTVRADIANAEQVTDAFVRIAQEFGRIDVLVNNARAPLGKDRVPVVELEPAEWDRVMGVNARGAFLCCQAVARHLIDRRGSGHIVNISSLAGRRGYANMAAYSASKFAMNGLTQSLAVELGPHDIRVNAICPGTVDTGRSSPSEAEEAKRAGIAIDEVRRRQFDRHVKNQALRQVGNAEDIAAMAAFLISPDAKHITGQCVNVCGGEIFN
jgi:3-oxoacyl-[acyl-carrier protein] reductase/meso-butanediol dehydrogenase/(S,S)-butanediol dehydrogenase/diacetyl reductase